MFTRILGTSLVVFNVKTSSGSRFLYRCYIFTYFIFLLLFYTLLFYLFSGFIEITETTNFVNILLSSFKLIWKSIFQWRPLTLMFFQKASIIVRLVSSAVHNWKSHFLLVGSGTTIIYSLLYQKFSMMCFNLS